MKESCLQRFSEFLDATVYSREARVVMTMIALGMTIRALLMEPDPIAIGLWLLLSGILLFGARKNPVTPFWWMRVLCWILGLTALALFAYDVIRQLMGQQGLIG